MALSWLAPLAGVAAGLLLLAAQRGRRYAGPLAGAGALTLLLAAAAQLTPHFDGYDTDLWVNALLAERVADGRPMLRLDPFLLQPPATPHVSLPWLLAGGAVRATGLSAHAVARGLALASGALLVIAAFRLAAVLFDAGRQRGTAVVLFALGLHAAWATLPLGRTLALGFVLLAMAESLAPGLRVRRVVLAAVWIALAFYAHLFAGLQALLAVGCAALARTDGVRERARIAGGAGLVGVLLAWPCFAYAIGTLGLERAEAHLHRPGQQLILGLRYLAPPEIVHLVAPGLLALAVAGLLARPPAGMRVARRAALVGSLASAVLLFTPLYELGLRAVGAWMPERLVHNGLPWVAATLALASFGAASGWRRLLAGAAVVALGAQAGLQVARDREDRPLAALLPRHRTSPAPTRRGGEARLYYAMTAAARDEARSLRPLMRERLFVSDPLLGYGTSASTLGRPLAVPAGHASPFLDFARRGERVRGAFGVNSAACWSRLFALYPDLELLLTPAPGAAAENLVWGRRGDPERVRRLFASHSALRPLFRGRFYVLDAVSSPLDPSRLPPAEGAPECAEP